MAFTRDQVQKVAMLARLNLTDQEIDQLGRQLGSILEYVEQLQAIDTDGVEPLAHCLPIENVFREDQVADSLSPDEALANAPKRSGDFYAVPPILD